MARKQMLAAAALGFLAVVLGAFGAHGLKSLLASAPDAAERLAWWSTGVRYQMWHALLLAVVAGLSARAPKAVLALEVAGVLIGVGVLLFSGSLYALTLSGARLLGAITPFGGLAFLAAWIAMGLGASRVLKE